MLSLIEKVIRSNPVTLWIAAALAFALINVMLIGAFPFNVWRHGGSTALSFLIMEAKDVWRYAPRIFSKQFVDSYKSIRYSAGQNEHENRDE